MPEEVDQRELVRKVGGVFHLCALIQKRMRELVMGARPLVEVPLGERRDLLSIVLKEIQQEKIGVAEEGESAIDLGPAHAGLSDLVSSIDLSDLASVVSDEDLAIPLPSDEDEEEDDEDEESETAGLTVEGESVVAEEEPEEEEKEEEAPDVGDVEFEGGDDEAEEVPE